MPTCSSISSTFPAARPISTAVTAGYSFQESSRLPMRSHPRATGSATEDFCFKTKGGNGRSTADSTERFLPRSGSRVQRGQFQSNPITAGNRADLRPNLEEAMPEESRIHKGVSGALRGEAKRAGPDHRQGPLLMNSKRCLQEKKRKRAPGGAMPNRSRLCTEASELFTSLGPRRGLVCRDYLPCLGHAPSGQPSSSSPFDEPPSGRDRPSLRFASR